MNIDYTVSTKKSFDKAVEDVVTETEKAGFKVLHIHNIQETLDKKGYKVEPLKIIEICNAANAYQAIQKDIKLALCLPCKINVYEKRGKIYISGMMPLIIKRVFPQLKLGGFIEKISKFIKKIVNNAAGL